MENLENMLDNIFGDVLVAAGFVAYLGPFMVKNPLLYPNQLYPTKRAPSP